MTEAREIGLQIRFRLVAAGERHRSCDENALRGGQKLCQTDRSMKKNRQSRNWGSACGCLR